MSGKSIKINDMNIPIEMLDAFVIGSGCAGLNAADWLYDLQVENIAVVTEGMNLGTSRNTGSDKQTYYKLTLSSSEPDSVSEMAKSLFEGKSVNGDTALIEAACSTTCFIKLANLGVPFPTNIYGEYVGYTTDHDCHKRATSAGPLTSKYMTEALEKSVKAKNIKIFDNTVILKLLTDENGIVGALGVCKDKLYTENRGLVIFLSGNVVFATGGPAGIYKNNVYPKCHTGMSGLAFEAGADAVNLQEWQYGLASIDFRWNVSGTYQQVLPRYISIDKDGVEREFLNDYFENPADAINFVFQKGYQWPFDTAKIKGSSIIDMIIFNETVNKGNKVYMDFTREPQILEGGFGCLSDEARNYLKNSSALVKSPIERLKIMNSKAIELYKSHGIDICKEPLRVEVCAQHNNGGIAVDMNWETNIKGLYAAGEDAGTFGVYRPGGSALNSTQVGSMRAAQNIALNKRDLPNIADDKLETLIEQDVKFISGLKLGTTMNQVIAEKREEYTKKMSNFASYIRIPEIMKQLLDDILHEYKKVLNNNCKDFDLCNVIQIYKLKDMLITQAMVLSSMIYSSENIGTRGGALTVQTLPQNKEIFDIAIINDNSYDRKLVKACLRGLKITNNSENVRPIPQSDLWFEKVWNEYMQRRNLQCVDS